VFSTIKTSGIEVAASVVKANGVMVVQIIDDDLRPKAFPPLAAGSPEAARVEEHLRQTIILYMNTDSAGQLGGRGFVVVMRHRTTIT
jgi:hypothetical protein